MEFLSETPLLWSLLRIGYTEVTELFFKE